MIYFREGRTLLPFILTENIFIQRRFVSCCHNEPKNISWQWSVKKTPDLMNCSNLCVSKKCPKPSFFPRFKKVFVPTDKKACQKKKPTMSWKEYLSFLLPDSKPKPPLITCRKLQTERRRCCGNPIDCKEDCPRVNCCPPPKEWYGQAEIFAVPSSLPSLPLPLEPPPCAPPPPSEPTCVLAFKGICQKPKRLFNMDDYAYKKAFSGINVCDDLKKSLSSFQCKSVCVPQYPGSDKNLRLSCGFFTEFKEVECPKAISAKNAEYDSPMHKHSKEDKQHQKNINIEVKKGVCGRTTFLKPYKYGDKLSGGDKPCQFHTAAYKIKPQTHKQTKMFLSTSHVRMNHSEGNEEVENHYTQAAKEDMKSENVETTSYLNGNSCCQPATYKPTSGIQLHFMQQKTLSGRVREGLAVPPEPYPVRENNFKYDSLELDPDLVELAEKTRKNMAYGIPSEKNEIRDNTNTLAKKLSKVAEEKMIKKANKKGIERPISPPIKSPSYKSKLSLLGRKKNSTIVTKATFMTEVNINIKCAKQNKGKNNKKNTTKKDIICEGCVGIKEAERQAKNPEPKPFLDCKVRPGGRCRGPQRKVFPDEGEPNNPYYKSKQKPYSMCNQPRPVIKKNERPYKMPCEDNNPKREFHSACSLIIPNTINVNKFEKNKFHSTTNLHDNNAVSNIPTLYDILKVKGLGKFGKQAHSQPNDWDSHTCDSYGERTFEENDSVPDLSKYQSCDNDSTIKKMSYPINIWENSEGKKKSSDDPWINNEANIDSLSMNRNESLNQNPMFNKHTQSPNIPKNLNHNASSKYNALFNHSVIRKQSKNQEKIINFIKEETNLNEKNALNSKTTGVHDFKPENRKSDLSNSNELTHSITTQNMWGEPQYLTGQGSPSNQVALQEMKSWDKQKSHSLNDNLTNDCSTHDIFKSKEESNQVQIKSENENQSMFYKEKLSLLSDGNNFENLNGSKSG